MKNTTASMRALMLGVILAHLGTYLVLPLLPLYLGMSKGMSVTQIGWILAASPFAFQAGSLLGGWLADRIGRRTVIAAGAWLNAAALAGIALAEGQPLLMAASFFSGLGIGLNAPSTKAAIASLVSAEEGHATK